MANRFYNNNNFTLHKMPATLDAQIKFGASGAVSSFQGLGITNITKPASSTGIYLIQFDDQYTNIYGVSISQGYGNVTGVAVNAGSFVTGTAYIIQTMGNTTQAQWVAAGVPVNTVAAVGVGFVATGAGAGTGTVKAYAGDTIVNVEAVGDPTLAIKGNPGATGSFGASVGSSLFIATLGTANTPVNGATGTTLGIEFYLGISSSPVNGVLG